MSKHPQTPWQPLSARCAHLRACKANCRCYFSIPANQSALMRMQKRIYLKFIHRRLNVRDAGLLFWLGFFFSPRVHMFVFMIWSRQIKPCLNFLKQTTTTFCVSFSQISSLFKLKWESRSSAGGGGRDEARPLWREGEE